MSNALTHGANTNPYSNIAQYILIFYFSIRLVGFKQDYILNFSFLGCLEDLWLEKGKTKLNSMKLMASLARAQAEVEAGVVADQYFKTCQIKQNLFSLKSNFQEPIYLYKFV